MFAFSLCPIIVEDFSLGVQMKFLLLNNNSERSGTNFVINGVVLYDFHLGQREFFNSCLEFCGLHGPTLYTYFFQQLNQRQFFKYEYHFIFT